MSFGSLLLVAAILKASSGMPYLSCEYEQIHKCHLGFEADFDVHANYSTISVYCDVFQVPNYRIRTNFNRQPKRTRKRRQYKANVERTYFTCLCKTFVHTTPQLSQNSFSSSPCSSLLNLGTIIAFAQQCNTNNFTLPRTDYPSRLNRTLSLCPLTAAVNNNFLNTFGLVQNL